MKDIAIIWDLDGTLLDTLQDLTDGTNYALRQFGLPERTAEEVRSFIGNGARQLIARSLPGKTDDPDVDEVLRVYQVYYRAHCQIKTRPYEGIPEALEQLKAAGFPMAVVSNKPDIAVKPLCDQYFPGLYAKGESADCPRKPAPDMVLKAMQALGVKKCIYVGDSEVDVVTANNAGVPCLSVTWGFRSRHQLESGGAVQLCDAPRNLPRMLMQMEEHYGQ